MSIRKGNGKRENLYCRHLLSKTNFAKVENLEIKFLQLL